MSFSACMRLPAVAFLPLRALAPRAARNLLAPTHACPMPIFAPPHATLLIFQTVAASCFPCPHYSPLLDSNGHHALQQNRGRFATASFTRPQVNVLSGDVPPRRYMRRPTRLRVWSILCFRPRRSRSVRSLMSVDSNDSRPLNVLQPSLGSYHILHSLSSHPIPIGRRRAPRSRFGEVY